MAKQLYIRKGNSAPTKDIIILGEESYLGGRDYSGYKPGKGEAFSPICRIDPFSAAKDITYVHATPNILLDTQSFQSDHDVHSFVKKYCQDIVSWDGETNQGRVRSREAFISKIDTDTACNELYSRLELTIHNKSVNPSKLLKKFITRKNWRKVGSIIKGCFAPLVFLLKCILSVGVIIFFTIYPKKVKKLLKGIWKQKRTRR